MYGVGILCMIIHNEEADTLEEVHEPYLIQEGFVKRTPQGSVLTDKAWRVLGLDGIAWQGDLF